MTHLGEEKSEGILGNTLKVHLRINTLRIWCHVKIKLLSIPQVSCLFYLKFFLNRFYCKKKKKDFLSGKHISSFGLDSRVSVG